VSDSDEVALGSSDGELVTASSDDSDDDSDNDSDSDVPPEPARSKRRKHKPVAPPPSAVQPPAAATAATAAAEPPRMRSIAEAQEAQARELSGRLEAQRLLTPRDFALLRELRAQQATGAAGRTAGGKRGATEAASSDSECVLFFVFVS
jgi:hypothetical protein